MTDPRQTEPEGGATPPPPRSSALELGNLQAPKGVEFNDPTSHSVYAWLVDLAKATRGVRVYADNNEMFHKFVDKAHASLGAVLEQVPELNLSVREDRLLFNGDPVLINPDREEGIPFILYRNAFRRITVLRGMSKDELVSLMRAVTADYGGADYAGEDLVTALWRMALPHLRYLTIDAITASSTSHGDDDDTKRIQASIEDIVAAIYRNNAADDDDDVVAGVSITKEDLEALKEIRQESVEDLEMLDRATERAIANIPASQIEVLRRSLEGENHEHLVERVMDIFLRILFREQSGRESAGTIQVIQQLYDSMLLGGRFHEARELVGRLRHSATHAEDLREMHIAKHLLQLFASEARVLPVLEAFSDEYGTSSVADKIRFLRALGPPVAPLLLSSLELLTTPGHRRLVCELIVEFGVPEPIELMRQIEGAKWFVVRDILGLAQHHPPERVSAIIASALRNEHPKVRQHAVGMLRGYARGLADKLLAERLRDAEIDVRLAAARVAAARRSVPCKVELEHILADDSVFEREPRELRTFMTAYAAIAGEEAVPQLDKILSPGFFARLKSLDAQIAAAFALGSIGGPNATAALQRGSRTLSAKVREACKRALAKEFKKGESREDILTGRGLRIPDAATTNPNQPLPTAEEGASPTPSGGTALDATPPKGNSMDIDFTIGSTADVQDMLEAAPAFSTEIDTSEPTVSLHPIERERPSLPRVDPLNPVREQMPTNLPPPPDLERPPIDSRNMEVMPVGLPPAPAGALPRAAPPEAHTETIRPPSLEDTGPSLEDTGDRQAAYEDIERELMAYLGVEGDALPGPEPTPVATSAPLEPHPSVESEPAVPVSQPRFGGAAADSGVWASAGSSGDSSPAWGAPSGATAPPPLEEDDLLIEAPTEIEQIPARAFAPRLPSEATTEVARRPPPEAPTEKGPLPVRPRPEDAPSKAPVFVEDLVLDDDEGGGR